MIRKLRREDIHQVMSIWLEGNLQAHNFIKENYWKAYYDSVQEQLLSAEVYVYEEEREEGKKDGLQHKSILGFAGMEGDYLAGIFVNQKFRSMGIGKCLLDHIKEYHTHFSLKVYQKNTKAIGFYHREGLVITAEGTDAETKEEEYTMTWR